MFLDLPIELVDEDVDGRIHVDLDLLCVNRAATHMDRGFGVVLELLVGDPVDGAV